MYNDFCYIISEPGSRKNCVPSNGNRIFFRIRINMVAPLVKENKNIVLMIEHH